MCGPIDTQPHRLHLQGISEIREQLSSPHCISGETEAEGSQLACQGYTKVCAEVELGVGSLSRSLHTAGVPIHLPRACWWRSRQEKGLMKQLISRSPNPDRTHH